MPLIPQRSRVVVFGAGALGILYAALLAEAGHPVTLVARSRRETLQRDGLRVRVQGGGWRTVEVDVVGTLASDADHDLALVFVRAHQLPAVLPTLSAATRIPEVVVLVQHAGGYDTWTEHLGDRLRVGFAGAAATFVDGGLEYQLAPGFLQPTTIGHLDGGPVDALVQLFRDAGIPAAGCADMAAWQKWHVAWIVAFARFVQHADGDVARLRGAQSRQRLARALQEGARALRAANVPVQPPKLRWLFALPIPMVTGLLWGLTRLPVFARDLVPNARTSPEEALLCGRQLRAIGREAGVEMPAWDVLLDDTTG